MKCRPPTIYGRAYDFLAAPLALFDSGHYNIFTMRKLEQERRARKWTQTQLAAKVGLAQGDISLIENGRMMPLPKHAKRLSRALGLSLDELTQDADGGVLA
jgi:DNA-binding XRE family transcriptional regulator